MNVSWTEKRNLKIWALGLFFQYYITFWGPNSQLNKKIISL